MKLLIINIGGTSTKLAIYDDEKVVLTETIRHNSSELKVYSNFWDQYDLRKSTILEFCRNNKYNLSGFDAIVSRGPVVKPLKSGVYKVSESMIADAKSSLYGNHPCGLGCKIAYDLANDVIPVLTVDPPCVDEMLPVAKYTGLPQIKRRSIFQALNHKAVAKRYAGEIAKKYENLNLVVCHLGSGISVASHKNGLVVDVTNGLDGDGPFGLDRVGTLPALDWMKLFTNHNYTVEHLLYMLNGHGGMLAHLGTNNALEIEKMILDGDKHALEVYEAMAFQVAKGIGAAATVFEARPDAIIITGGLANSHQFTTMLIKKIEWISKVIIMPGEDEMLALAEGAIRGLRGIEPIYDYI
jgi:butyrate kinase